MELYIQVLALLLMGTLPPPAVRDLFDAGSHHAASESNPDRKLNYRLFRPLAMQPGEKYPLIVWLHGYGDLEFDQFNYGQLQHVGLVLPSLEVAAEAKYFLLALQCPKDQRGFFGTALGTGEGGDSSPEPGEVVVELVKKLLQSEPIDAERISLTGISGGATDAWEMAMRYPRLFAGLAPLGGGQPDLERLNRLESMSVWAFHAKNDTLMPVADVRAAVSRLRKLGGRAYLTEVEGRAKYNHDSHTQAITRFRMHEWLVSQTRDGKGPLPLQGRWRLWASLQVEELLASGAPYYLPLPAALVCCWYVYRRQFRRTQRKAAALDPA